jgi:hypothetical protein
MVKRGIFATGIGGSGASTRGGWSSVIATIGSKQENREEDVDVDII